MFLNLKVLYMRKYRFSFFSFFLGLFFVTLLVSQKAHSYEITDKWYGSLNAGVGYTHKQYANAGKNGSVDAFFAEGVSLAGINIFSAIGLFNTHEYNGVLRTQKKHHYAFLQVWNNFYYKLADKVHPFVGLQANVSIPLTDTKFIENNLTCALGQIFVKDLFTLNVLLGTKFVLSKKENVISISPYGLLGMGVANVKQIKDKQYLGFASEGYNFGWLANTDLGYNKFNYINLNAGAGLEVQVNKMILGVEYRYTTYKSKVGDLYEDVSFKVVNHNVSVKIGYQFL